MSGLFLDFIFRWLWLRFTMLLVFCPMWGQQANEWCSCWYCKNQMLMSFDAALIFIEHVRTQTGLISKSVPQAMIWFYNVNPHLHDNISSTEFRVCVVLKPMCVFVCLCCNSCVCAHAQTVRSKERKALCRFYTPNVFICLQICYKGKQTQRWLKKKKKTCAP